MLSIRGIFYRFGQFKNWYWPNRGAIRNHRIHCKAGAPACSQYTLVSGQGTLTLGNKCQFGYKLGGRFRKGSVEIQPRYQKSAIVIADRVFANNNVFICAANYIEIGMATLIGEGVTIMDHEAHGIEPENRRLTGEIGEIKIGSNVWIGNNVTILKNSFIGDNTIVAAGAIVSGTFPANVIIGGVPAKLIRNL
jgi:acetyltransferase-like isoleucine patch superfamily enzyme